MKSRGAPKRAVFYAVTSACPRKCAFCFNAAVTSLDRPFDRLAYESVLMEMVRLSSKLGTSFRLNLTGGEPLLEPLIAEIAVSARKQGLATGITTAGISIPSDTLAQLSAAGVDTTISFDSCDQAAYEQTRGSGTYQTAVDAIEALSRAGCLSRAIVVATKVTEPSLVRTVEWLSRYGLAEFVLMELTVAAEEFARLGVRIDESLVQRCREAAPRARFVLGHQCPVTLNVTPDGRYFVQSPPDVVEILGHVGEVSLEQAFRRCESASTQIGVWPPEVFEPLESCSSADCGKQA